MACDPQIFTSVIKKVRISLFYPSLSFTTHPTSTHPSTHTMADDPKQMTTKSSGPSSDPSSLPSQASPSDSPNTPQSSMSTISFTAHSPIGGTKGQNQAATPTTNDSKADSDRPRPSQPSDEASMEMADFDELKARLEAHREHSVQTFHGNNKSFEQGFMLFVDPTTYLPRATGCWEILYSDQRSARQHPRRGAVHLLRVPDSAVQLDRRRA